ncbi:MAG: ribosome-binding factor A [Parcubacteria group bacterium CG23_combo_of_CG06-09_8_20_14_all_35_9]|nr:MAG: ribosome-binding factor A [Parcubacteria group bacterium CG23_combo_of_CG06-09_8_20_14_all_35_9]
MSRRILQVNKLIKQELGNLFLKEIEFPKECLVTITKVDTSGDLKTAKIYFSVLPIDCAEKTLQILEKNASRLQKPLNKRLVMYCIPKINFEIDRTEEKAENIEKLLNKIDRT